MNDMQIQTEKYLHKTDSNTYSMMQVPSEEPNRHYECVCCVYVYNDYMIAAV